MAVSVVVGGQFGSEGKGKVALDQVRRAKRAGDKVIAVRVGGPNSGHTGVRASDGSVFALRQLPAAAIDGDADVVLPPGSYIDVDQLFSELEAIGLPYHRVRISELANVVTEAHRAWEHAAGLTAAIGSTGSGTGAAVLARAARQALRPSLDSRLARDEPRLRLFRLEDTSAFLRNAVRAGERIVVEGTQGFGLSVFHSEHWPKATSRDTTAAGFLAEAGLSPFDVDTVALVIRCHPIRVAGDSGRFERETSWPEIAEAAGIEGNLREYTTVTRKERRVGHFESAIVKQAIDVNRPSLIVLNHLDYVDNAIQYPNLTMKASSFVEAVERSIGQRVDLVGTGPDELVPYRSFKHARTDRARHRHSHSPEVITDVRRADTSLAL